MQGSPSEGEGSGQLLMSRAVSSDEDSESELSRAMSCGDSEDMGDSKELGDSTEPGVEEALPAAADTGQSHTGQSASEGLSAQLSRFYAGMNPAMVVAVPDIAKRLGDKQAALNTKLKGVPSPSALNPQLETRNPKPETLNPKS